MEITRRVEYDRLRGCCEGEQQHGVSNVGCEAVRRAEIELQQSEFIPAPPLVSGSGSDHDANLSAVPDDLP
jgi:hypothetical protein